MVLYQLVDSQEQASYLFLVVDWNWSVDFDLIMQGLISSNPKCISMVHIGEMINIHSFSSSEV